MMICNNELLVKGVIKAWAHRTAGHQGQHEKPLQDGSILKWGAAK